MKSAMAKSLLTILRDKKTGRAVFRETADKMAHILAQESFHYLSGKQKTVLTPFEKTVGWELGAGIVLVPILRAGLGFLPAFLYFFQDAKIGLIGLKRDEKTAEAKEYYRNLPRIKKTDLVIVLDPMIATGGSATYALHLLKQKGVAENKIIFVSLIGAPVGLKRVKKNFPKVKVITAAIERKLNKDKFILPGVGDFGDRFFGTVG